MLVGVDEDVLAVEDDSELMMVVLVAKRPAPLLQHYSSLVYYCTSSTFSRVQYYSTNVVIKYAFVHI